MNSFAIPVSGIPVLKPTPAKEEGFASERHGEGQARGNSPMRSSVNPCGTSLMWVVSPQLAAAAPAHTGDLGGGAAELRDKPQA